MRAGFCGTQVSVPTPSILSRSQSVPQRGTKWNLPYCGPTESFVSSLLWLYFRDWIRVDSDPVLFPTIQNSVQRQGPLPARSAHQRVFPGMEQPWCSQRAEASNLAQELTPLVTRKNTVELNFFWSLFAPAKAISQRKHARKNLCNFLPTLNQILPWKVILLKFWPFQISKTVWKNVSIRECAFNSFNLNQNGKTENCELNDAFSILAPEFLTKRRGSNLFHGTLMSIWRYVFGLSRHPLLPQGGSLI